MDGLTIGFSQQANNGGGNAGVVTDGVTVSTEVPGTSGSKTTLVLAKDYGGVNGVGGNQLHMFVSDSNGIVAGKGTDPSGTGFVITDAPIPFVPIAEVGYPIDSNGLAVSGSGLVVESATPTSVTPPTVYEATESFPWGGSETTYFDGNGAILGYSSSQGTSYSYTDASGATQQSVNLQLFDANHDPIGSVYQDEYGSGSNFRITVSDDASGTVTNVPAVGGVNTQYIQETGTSTHTGPNGESQTREFVYNYAIEPRWLHGQFPWWY